MVNVPDATNDSGSASLCTASSRGRWPVVQPRFQCIQRPVAAAGHDLDTPIVKVYGTAGKSQPQRPLTRGRTEKHTLDTPGDEKPATTHGDSPA